MKAKWQPIKDAPLDGTEVLLTRWTKENGYGTVDFGAFGFLEISDWDGKEVYDWSSNYGYIEDPTHFMYVETPEE